jgi:hypothetical protein
MLQSKHAMQKKLATMASTRIYSLDALQNVPGLGITLWPVLLL